MRHIMAVMIGLTACVPFAAQAAAPYGCPQHLSPQAKKVFDAVDAMPEQAPLRQRLETQVRRLVMAGDLKRSDARPAAEEASACLRAH